jgi:hypothetical protein
MKIKKVIIEDKLPDSCEECNLKTPFENVFEKIMICNLVDNGVCVGTHCLSRHPNCPLELFIPNLDKNCNHNFVYKHLSINAYRIFVCLKCGKEVCIAPEEINQFISKYKIL